MATLKVNFVFTTDWTEEGNNFAVSANLKQALTNLDAYNTQRDSNNAGLDNTKPVSTQYTAIFEVYIEDNAKATIALVKQELQTFINAVDAYNVTLDCTHNIFNTAKVPAKTWQY